jgi:hypothetical protein
MKKNLLKIGILTTALIFAFTSASWADGRKKGKYHPGAGKYIQNKHYPAASYHKQGWKRGPYPAVHKHYHHPKVVHKHYYYPAPVYAQPYYPYAYAPGYYAYAPPYNEFSVSAVIVQPGFALSIGAGSQW